MATLRMLYEKQLAFYQQDSEAAKNLASQPLGALPSDLHPSEAAAWTAVANVLLNLDAVLTRN
jgi:hypothetical protein